MGIFDVDPAQITQGRPPSKPSLNRARNAKETAAAIVYDCYAKDEHATNRKTGLCAHCGNTIQGGVVTGGDAVRKRKIEAALLDAFNDIIAGLDVAKNDGLALTSKDVEAFNQAATMANQANYDDIAGKITLQVKNLSKVDSKIEEEALKSAKEGIDISRQQSRITAARQCLMNGMPLKSEWKILEPKFKAFADKLGIKTIDYE